MTPAGDITFRQMDGQQAAAGFGELRALYTEVYAEPPYEWGEEHADLFAERFDVQRRRKASRRSKPTTAPTWPAWPSASPCSRPHHGGTT
jgi:hypothetical protein